MKALSTLKSAINQSSILGIIALIVLVPVIYPHYALAADIQTSGQSAIVFKIKDLKVLEPQNQILLSYNDLLQSDPLVIKLKAYLEAKNSPLKDSAGFIITQPKWERAIAISFVESNMCRFTPKHYNKGKYYESYNCSGIGGDNYRKYTSYEDWFVDMNNLLMKPNYVNRPIEKFLNYYVVPGSPNWLKGVKKVEADITKMKEEAEEERLALNRHFEVAMLTGTVNFPR